MLIGRGLETVPFLYTLQPVLGVIDMPEIIWAALAIGGCLFGAVCQFWAVRWTRIRLKKLKKVMEDYRKILAENKEMLKKNKRTSKDNRRMAAKLDELEARFEKLVSDFTIH